VLTLLRLPAGKRGALIAVLAGSEEILKTVVALNRVGLLLAVSLLVGSRAQAQSSLVPFTTNVSLYACPGGLRQIIPISASVPTAFDIHFAGETWLSIYANRLPQTPTWIAFSVAGTPGAPVDVTLTPADGTAPVVLHVSWSPKPDCNPNGNSNGQVTVTPPALGLFGTAKTLTVQTASPSPVPFSVTTTAHWLSVDWATSYTASSSVPATVSILANTAGLPVSTFSAAIVITPLGQTPIYIPVEVETGLPDSPGGPYAAVPQLTFHGGLNGSPPASQDLPVTGQYPDFIAGAAVLDSSMNWLSVARGAGQDLTVSVNQAGLPAGVFQGRISLTANNTTVYTLVTLIVDNPASNVTAAPAALSFDYSLGAPFPASQGVSISSATLPGVPVSFAATVATEDAAPWLSVNPTAGSAVTPASFTVSVNPTGLTPGTHRGWIALQPTGSAAVQVPVIIVVRPAASLSINPSNVAIQFYSREPCAAFPNICETRVLVSSANGAPLSFTAQATSTGGWFSVKPTSGTISGSGPLALTLVNDPNLAAGTYNGTLQVTAANDTSISASAPVTATVLPPIPLPTTFLNAASFAPAHFSPGEVIAVFGDNLGPDAPVTGQPDSNGKYPTQLGGVSVLLGDYNAPLLYVSRTQVNMIAPYVLCRTSCATPAVQGIFLSQNNPVFFYLPALTPSEPAIFSIDGSGQGGGAILNQDNSVNSSSSPATKGSIVQVYMTGEGQTSPSGIDGQITSVSAMPPITPKPLLDVTATIGGKSATVTFDGEAPALVAGVMQVNIQIPMDSDSGALPIQVFVGGKPSQNGITVAVQ
jgi:uncharacterized protein (TIGR03437 family)